jgi:antirestriction protein ArdC
MQMDQRNSKWGEYLREMGYPSQGWMTFKQANDLGARVRKGEKSCTVVFTSFKPTPKRPTKILEEFPFL